MLGAGTALPPLVCTMLIEALDAASWAVLGTAGATPEEARSILTDLWTADPYAGR